MSAIGYTVDNKKPPCPGGFSVPVEETGEVQTMVAPHSIPPAASPQAPFVLRPFQLTAILDVRNLMRQGKKSVCLVSPTGSGKTVISSFVIQSALEKAKRILFLAHRRELIEQCAAKLQALGVWDYNIILPGHHGSKNPKARVQIGSIQTVTRRNRPPADLIVLDEAHHAVSRQYRNLLAHYPDAYVLGLTATPERLDGKGLGDIFSDLYEVASVPDLIRDGYLVQPRYVGPSAAVAAEIQKALAAVHTRGGDYDENEMAEAMDRPSLIGDIIGHWRQWAQGRKTIVFAANVAHSKHIVAQFNAAGIRAAHVDGEMPVRERERIIKGWRGTAVDVVSNCMILTEGFDFPELYCCILARRTKSLALYLQMVGRVMRPADGKDGAIILDHAGNIFEHGPPHERREWTLEGGTKRKKPAVEICLNTACGNAFSVHEARPRFWLAPRQARVISDYREAARLFEEVDRGGDFFKKEGRLLECPACRHATCRLCGNAMPVPQGADTCVCRTCGAEYQITAWAAKESADEIAHGDGVLELLSDDDMQIVKQRMSVKNSYNKLLETARTRGYSRGWVWHRLRETYSEEQLRENLPRHTAGWWKQNAAQGQ